MILIANHIVPDGTQPTRLSDYAVGIFDLLPSRKGVKKAIKKGAIRVNGIQASTGHWVTSGEVIGLYEVEKPPLPLALPLEILYEDEDLAIVHKPAGLVVSGNQYRTLENALSYNLRPSSLPDARPWPRPVHRLDSPTSGLMLVAKTTSAEIALRKQFETRVICKTYQAVVTGNIADAGKIDFPLEDRPAITEYQVLERLPSRRNGWLCRVRLHPLTGRTHQLRKHLAGIGHPILGDKTYGEEGKILLGKGLFLAAVALDFTHPRSGELLREEIQPPAKFIRYMEWQARDAE